MPLDEDTTRYTAPPEPLGSDDSEGFNGAAYRYGRYDRYKGVKREDCPFVTRLNKNLWLDGWDLEDRKIKGL